MIIERERCRACVGFGVIAGVFAVGAVVVAASDPTPSLSAAFAALAGAGSAFSLCRSRHCPWMPVHPRARRTRRDNVEQWFVDVGAELVQHVDRLWPHEKDPAYRAACLAEEAGEVNRAVTKRRHASHSPRGMCKGMTVEQWTGELETETAQALCVALDIMYREGFEPVQAIERCVTILREREAGT